MQMGLFCSSVVFASFNGGGGAALLLSIAPSEKQRNVGPTFCDRRATVILNGQILVSLSRDASSYDYSLF